MIEISDGSAKLRVSLSWMAEVTLPSAADVGESRPFASSTSLNSLNSEYQSTSENYASEKIHSEIVWRQNFGSHDA